MRRATITTGVILLSGCLQPNQAPHADAAPAAFVQPALVGCERWIVEFLWPGPTNPVPPPPGWEPALQKAFTDTSYGLMVCDRVYWGELDRGPVSLVFVANSNRETPANCARDEKDAWGNVMESMYVSDSALAAAMEDTRRFPVHAGEVEIERANSTDGFVEATVRWRPDGAYDFSWANLAYKPPDGHQFDQNFTQYWDWGGGMARWDLSGTYHPPEAKRDEAHTGWFMPPTTPAITPAGAPYAGRIRWFDDVSITGDVTFF